MSRYDFVFKHLTSGIQVAQEAILPARVYPNPAQNQVKVSIAEPAWCRLYNMSGKQVYEQYYNAGDNLIDISTIPKGVYLMRLQGKNKFYQQKLLVE